MVSAMPAPGMANVKDTWQQDQVHQAQGSLPFKQAKAFRQILKNKFKQCNYFFLHARNSLVIPFSSHK